MFVGEPNHDTLRQGDLCSVPFFPIWQLPDTTTTTSAEQKITSVNLPALKRVIPADSGFLACVCTQCCDIENNKGRVGITIAPVRPAPLAYHDGGARERLATSGEPKADGTFEWFHVFPLELPQADGSSDLVVVDWSAIISIGPHDQAIAKLRATKSHELLPVTRAHFRTKLAASFGRPDED
ncbi:MAG: hypothetical protein M3Y91_02210 [Actinomycetota bacterium]|nr:hypothetical protein [Actinomycetota bacterium]